MLSLRRPFACSLFLIGTAAMVSGQTSKPTAKPTAKPSATTPAKTTAAATPTPAPKPAEPWLTWGGPRKDFTVTTGGFAESWPESGPTRVWSRALGDGYSAIAAEGGTLYTAYRRGSDDVVTALDAQTGKSIWESTYSAPFKNAGGANISDGPYAMPQVVGDRLVMASGIGQLMSLDKRTGKIVWQHDLYKEYGGTRLGFGYSCHALPYKDTLIVLVGGRPGMLSRITGGTGSGVIAFKQSDGTVAWQNLTFDNAHSSPVLINVDGQPQVVALAAQEVVAFSPDNGQLLWRHPHPTPYGLAISNVVWGPDNILFVSSGYGAGSRGLEVHQKNGQSTVRELWQNARVQLHFGTAVRVGDHVFLSDAYDGPAFVTALNVKTGVIKWQQRGFAKAHWIGLAPDTFVLLDEDGTLALVKADAQGFQVRSQVSLLKKTAWTVPTIVGTRLYVRDRGTIMALDLGAAPARAGSGSR